MAMNGDCTTSTVQQSELFSNEICDQLSILALNGDGTELISDKSEKDPRKIARKYQIDLCEKAMKENVIVYMGTGCGKTHIAVLLIYEMRHLIVKPQKNICIFLAPTVALVQQQAKVIENSLDFKVGIYCGSATHLRGHHNWEKEIEEYEVLVMTPQTLLHYLSHCFIKIELIALLIFDECHYAQLESNHPYAEIMKIFYDTNLVKLPRIFGMTASPKLGKAGSIDGLESLLRAKVYSVDDKDELEQYVQSAKVNVYYYDSSLNGYSHQQNIYIRKLEYIKHQCISTLRANGLDQSSQMKTKKSLQNLHCNLEFCIENLGLWGTVQACYILLKGDHYETNMVEANENCSDDNLCNKYLHQAASVLASDCSKDGTLSDLSCVEALKEPFFSRKLLRLIDILSGFRSQSDMKCIIFVNRIVTARSLSYILRHLKFLSAWKCGFLVGVHSGLVSCKQANAILDKFRSGELNLLVATKVGEEGLDIQACCLVIRFDLPETVASFIQSRGRARMPQSEYAILVDRSKPEEIKLIEHFINDEDQMNEEISRRKPHVPITDFDVSKTYKVDSTGATISAMASISLLHRYCSKLPHDEFFNPKPQFSYVDMGDGNGKVCYLILPANAPIHEIISTPQPSTEEAKRDVCLKACKVLHEIGALTDYLLPEQDDSYEESTQELSNSESCDDDDSRAELHEMLVPAALKEPWTVVENSICFNSYYINICPNPADRVYRRFGLYVKNPLPEKAENMKLDLCLARGRMVGTQLIPSGVTTFDQVEIEAAEKFQHMFLKIILDRHDFAPEYVSLEHNGVCESSPSTFYLLLPVIQHECEKISVDWTLINRCLSSPIFRQPGMGNVNEVSQDENCLHLANGRKSIDDVVNSLVYVPCKNTFYFISDVLPEKNGYSAYDDSESHLEHCIKAFDLPLVYPDQALLKAKQLFVLDNLLRKKNQSGGEWREKEEHFIEMPPEICQLKIIGFSKDIGSSLSLLPSIIHRLESTLVAIELKDKLVASFPEGAEITADRILEALTTERCGEHFSLERLEVLGDAFLKFAVGRHLFLKYSELDEGQLTRKRSNLVNNSNLLKLATKHNLQVYIRDESFDANQFFPFGRPCPVICDKESEKIIHPLYDEKKHETNKVRCNKSHHWLHKKTIADFVEALIGAFIVDSGFKAATSFLNWLGMQVDFTPTQIDNICFESKMFLPLADQTNVNAVEKMLNYDFVHKGLLVQAFVHPSYNKHSGGCYQRLEFLGDAVLDYMITSYLYSVYPNMKPGHLTDLRSVAVNNVSFADVAGRRSFHKYIICDSSVLRDAMNKYVDKIANSEKAKWYFDEKSCPKVLGDLVESCIGATFLDTGFNLSHTWKVTMSLLDPIICNSKLQLNPLRELQELCQSHNWEVKMSLSKKDGKFSCEAKVDEKRASATAFATHTSGKAAKRMAARQIIESLQDQGHRSKSKSLEEVLRNSEKKEAQLIGYDETPTQGSANPCCINAQNTSQSDCDTEQYPVNRTSTSTQYHKAARPIKRPPSPNEVSERLSALTMHENGSVTHQNDSNDDRQGTGGPCSKNARSHLYEVCTANCWKLPLFECCNEIGPPHLREFIYKIVLRIEELPNEIFEICGEPCSRKKGAAEHAAEAALWFLKHEGYI